MNNQFTITVSLSRKGFSIRYFPQNSVSPLKIFTKNPAHHSEARVAIIAALIHYKYYFKNM